MLVNWDERWVELGKNGITIKLQVEEEVATIHLCELVQLEKESKDESEFMIAQI
jgi:hypothetical protein